MSLVPRPTENLSVISKDSFCIVEPVEESRSTKIMFVVDNSSSNEQNDADGSKRAENINRFVASATEEDSYELGLILFNTHSESPINYENNTNKPKFTSDRNEFYQATQTILDSPFRGGTNYSEAINLVNQAIQDDIRLFPDTISSYIILFISDGRPSDANSNERVKDLIDINREIYLSTAYYGTFGPEAIAKLQEIAALGLGNFVNFETGDNWNFNQLIVKNDVIPWNLKEFLVYNLNAGFCLDGKVDVDSDADGMCDRDEISMNTFYSEELKAEGKRFDPANRFSFGDGYGDFFHWLRFRYPGKTLRSCEDRSDDDFDLLTKCEENELQNRSNAEGAVSKGDPKSFDTDRDGIIDGIETFVYFASQSTGRTTRYTAALDRENVKDSPDGEESVLVQIKQHRNPWFHDPDAKAYDTTLTPLNNSKEDCYLFHQSTLPLYRTLEVKEGNTLPGLEHSADENAVMVYYIQVLQPEPDSVGVLRHSVQHITGPISSGLQVKEGTFKQYLPPKQ